MAPLNSNVMLASIFTKFRKPQKKSDISYFSVRVLDGDNVVETTIECYTLYSDRFRKGGYHISGEFPSLGMVSQMAPSLFGALFELRKTIEDKDMKLGVWGAKKSVWPSGMERDMGGGFMASDRASKDFECNDVLDPIPINESATTEEQEKWVRSNITNHSRRTP